MPTNNAEKVLLYFDEKAFSSKKSAFDALQTSLNRLIDLFNKLKVGDFEKSEMSRLLSDPESLMISKIFKSETPTIAGHEISIAKAYDIIKKPAGLPVMLQEHTLLTKKISSLLNNEWHFSVGISSERDLIAAFHFNKEGKLILSSEIEEKIKQSCEVYIHSERARLMHSVSKQLMSLINESELRRHLIHNGSPQSLISFLTDGVKRDDINKKLTLNFEAIKAEDYKK